MKVIKRAILGGTLSATMALAPQTSFGGEYDQGTLKQVNGMPGFPFSAVVNRVSRPHAPMAKMPPARISQAPGGTGFATAPPGPYMPAGRGAITRMNSFPVAPPGPYIIGRYANPAMAYAGFPQYVRTQSRRISRPAGYTVSPRMPYAMAPGRRMNMPPALPGYSNWMPAPGQHAVRQTRIPGPYPVRYTQSAMAPARPPASVTPGAPTAPAARAISFFPRTPYVSPVSYRSPYPPRATRQSKGTVEPTISSYRILPPMRVWNVMPASATPYQVRYRMPVMTARRLVQPLPPLASYRPLPPIAFRGMPGMAPAAYQARYMAGPGSMNAARTAGADRYEQPYRYWHLSQDRIHMQPWQG
jgi:hypothetical protein